MRFSKNQICFQVCYLIDFADMKHTLDFLKRTKLISYFSKKYHFLKMNLFGLFLLSNQKHPPYDQTFQKAILAKFLLQFNSICILCRHCLHRFSKFSGSHSGSVMVNSQRLRIDACYFCLDKLIQVNGDLSWYFSKLQFAYLENLCDVE